MKAIKSGLEIFIMRILILKDFSDAKGCFIKLKKEEKHSKRKLDLIATLHSKVNKAKK